MATIKCINTACKAFVEKFQWDEAPYVENNGGVVPPGTPGSIPVLATCPICKAKNRIWLKNPKMIPVRRTKS